MEVRRMVIVEEYLNDDAEEPANLRHGRPLAERGEDFYRLLAREFEVEEVRAEINLIAPIKLAE
jgi:hypothetical protein